MEQNRGTGPEDRSNSSEQGTRPEPSATEANELSASPQTVRFSENSVEDLSVGNGDIGTTLVVLESAEPCLNFRADPPSAGKVFECLEPGTVLGPIGRLEGWLYVELNDNRSGWVSEARRPHLYKWRRRSTLLIPTTRQHLDLNETGLAATGTIVRLEVSSSNFPRFARNLNTGGNNYDKVEGVVAMNTVHHSAGHPSQVRLPVVKN